MIPKFFNAQHCPIGAFASFTLGMKGKNGGFGKELKGPACQNVYVGCETQRNVLKLLPFFDGGATSEELNDFGIQTKSLETTILSKADDTEITREFGACVDRWITPTYSFTIYSPLSNPQKHVQLPVVYAELEVRNDSNESRRWVFGFDQNHPQYGIRPYSTDGVRGIQNGNEIVIASDTPGVRSGNGFEPGMVLNPRRDINNEHLLGDCGICYGEIAPHSVATIRFVIAFHKRCYVTSGIDTHYAYVLQHNKISDVVNAGFADFERAKQSAVDFDQKLRESGLSEARNFQLSHAIRSYYGSTQHLVSGESGQHIWVVNEGEYRMMNTLDLTADMVYWEIDQHPWTVKNVLDFYVERYSYRDQLVRGEEIIEGGISFTHDMGTTNMFSRPGYSSYERAGYDDCFSYMTVEELINWLGVATVYALKKDLDWAKDKLSLLEECLVSLIRRDHPDPEQRKGWIQWDSSRCEGGAEITTYDSLDISLGQSRGSGYLAGKIFGVLLNLAEVFRQLGKDDLAAKATEQADRCANAIVSMAKPNGVIPAVFEGENESTIIPHIEGLVWPLSVGLNWNHDGKYDQLKAALSKHLTAVLKPGICKFPEGGWKLSSTSDNSWLSKIYICQFVAEAELGFEPDEEADRDHVWWLTRPESHFFAWSDQMVNGIAIGSKYYPRGVSAWLWTK